MPSTTPDRTLRRLVVRLASAHPDDIADVLGAMAPDARERAEALLRAYLPDDGSAPVFDGFAEPPARASSHLSPWLAARLADDLDLPEADSPALRPFRMTPQARAALRTCADALPKPDPAPIPPRLARVAPSGLWARLRGYLSGTPAWP